MTDSSSFPLQTGEVAISFFKKKGNYYRIRFFQSGPTFILGTQRSAQCKRTFIAKIGLDSLESRRISFGRCVCVSLLFSHSVPTTLCVISNCFRHARHRAEDEDMKPFRPILSAPGASSNITDAVKFMTRQFPHRSRGVFAGLQV